jgi:hypothetical protein
MMTNRTEGELETMSDIANWRMVRDLRKLEQKAANDDIDYGTPDKPIFRAFRSDGTEVKRGDTITTSRGEEVTYTGCKHPRKVQTDMMGCEKYPSVFDLEIRGPEGYVWNAVSEEGRRLAAAG